jgi:phosphatidylserine decarboxylase
MMGLIDASITNLISRGFGKIASTKFPTFLQTGINKLYTSVTGLDLSNFYPESHYESLNALFTRELRFEREFSKDPSLIISPCDSLVSAQGAIEKEMALQIKGFEYSVRELLSEQIESELIEDLEGGEFINFYLSPRDYHRYHVPMDMRVKKVVHIPGVLYPVNFTYLKKVPSLFVRNERVILECYDTQERLFFIVLVGALNVGKMTLGFEPKIETNSDVDEPLVLEYEKEPVLNKGEELGMFMMGSTIVMLFEKDFVKLENREGKKVRFGDVIATKLKA